jgi:hypothetical protein
MKSFNYLTLVRDFLGRKGRTETQGQQNLLRYYASRNSEGRFNPGMDLIEADTGLCQQTVSRFNNYFKALGILDWKRGWGNDSGSQSNLYQLNAQTLQELSTTPVSVVPTIVPSIVISSTTHPIRSTTHFDVSTTPVGVPKNQALEESSNKNQARKEFFSFCDSGTSDNESPDLKTKHPANKSMNEGTSDFEDFAKIDWSAYDGCSAAEIDAVIARQREALKGAR